MSNGTKKKSLYVYHEKQGCCFFSYLTKVASALCGKHCLNALFQKPIFTEVDLSNFARELDEHERIVMTESGVDTKEFLKFMSEDSGNVDDGGNFSIQVLMKALHQYGLECKPVTLSTFPQVFSSLHHLDAFICNRGSHWFTIRKVDGEFYDLNSFNNAPKRIPELLLAEFLSNLIGKNHIVYLVEGKLPEPSLTRETSPDGKWVRVQGDDESDMELAIAASLHESKTKQNTQVYPSREQQFPNFSEQVSLINNYFQQFTTMMEKVEGRLQRLEQTLYLLHSQN